MLHNSISVDMKVYALSLIKFTVGFPVAFCKILEQLLSRIILESCFSKKPRGVQGNRVTIIVSGFQVVSTNFRIAKPSNLDYVIHFYIPKKRLSPVITIKILAVKYLVAIRPRIKVLPHNFHV